jgi:hypothetical protein
MTAIGLFVFGLGVMLGVSILFVQVIGMLCCGSMSKWTNPLPTIAGMGLVIGIGILTMLFRLLF